MTRFDDRYAEANFFESGVWDKVPEGIKYHCFWRYPNILSKQCRINRWKEAPTPKRSSVRSAVLIVTPTCDTQTHRAIAGTRAGIASRG